MDPANISWLEASTNDSYWEAYHRRSDSEGDRDGSSDDVPPDFDDNEDVGMISEGENAWLKLSTTANRIHHHCSVATNTHRCAHRHPNLAQVPSDERFRQLFIPTEGLVLCGADLSGIELRMLSHYLARFDGGRYAEILLNGDIHQVNADKIGISRKQVKTVTYAFLYGAGDEKIGHSYDAQLSTTAAKRKGKEIRSAYVSAVDGLGDLLTAVAKAAERGSSNLSMIEKLKLIRLTKR